MTLVLLASICAYVVGYGLILIANAAGYWEGCFYFMIIMVVPFLLWILSIPNMYLDPMLAPEKKPEELENSQGQLPPEQTPSTGRLLGTKGATPSSRRFTNTSANNSLDLDGQIPDDEWANPLIKSKNKDNVSERFVMPTRDALSRRMTAMSAQTG